MPNADMSSEIRVRLFAILDKNSVNDSSLERALHLTPKTVSNWRRGASHSYMKMLGELAEFLNIQLYELIRDETVKTDDLTSDEQELLIMYRRTERLSVPKRKALRDTIGKLIDLYTKTQR